MGKDPKEVRHDSGNVVGSLESAGRHRPDHAGKVRFSEVSCRPLPQDWEDSWLAERIYQQSTRVLSRRSRGVQKGD